MQGYFDITGGEILILVAFGIISAEYKTGMHYFDIEKNEIFEFASDDNKKISKTVNYRKIDYTAESYIELQGGSIQNKLKKGMKNIESREEIDDMQRMWPVAKRNWLHWNQFSGFLRENFRLEDGLSISVTARRIQTALCSANSKLKSASTLNKMLDNLAKAGVLSDVVHNNKEYKFTFKNQFVKNVIWDAGSLLELKIYQDERQKSSSCSVGVHIDWDGIESYMQSLDVVNEIDVLSIEGNIPTFISCKSGKMDGEKALTALYELETIAKRFGGKYVRKVLVVTKVLSDAHKNRAGEMGIEIRYEGNDISVKRR